MSAAPATREEAPTATGTGAVMLTVADTLTSHGLDVRGPEWEHRHYLKITNVPGVLSDVAIDDDGTVLWEHHLCHGSQADPAYVTAVVSAILDAGGTTTSDSERVRHQHLTLTGIVGRALADRGLRVSLEVVYVDQVCYQVYSEIAVTNPARPARGAVRIADDSSIRWDCRLHDPTTSAPGLHPAEIAATIATALTGPTVAFQIE